MCAVCEEIKSSALTPDQAFVKIAEIWQSLDRYHRDDLTKLALNLQKIQQKGM